MNEDNKDEYQYELEKLRMKKMRALMEAQKQKEAVKERVVSISEKIDFVLRVVMSPEAYTHLSKLKNNEPNVYQSIYSELISPDVIQSIDYLINIIRHQGGVSRKIPLDAIRYLERKAKGIKSKIQVQRGDDIMDLSSYLTKE